MGFNAKAWVAAMRAGPGATLVFMPAVQNALGSEILRAIGHSVLRETARTHNVAPGVLLGLKKTYSVQRARLALYRALKDLGWSYAMIGTFTKRHWTTVRDALKRRKRDGSKSSAKRTQRRVEARAKKERQQ